MSASETTLPSSRSVLSLHGDFQIEEAAIAVVARRVVGCIWIGGKELPIGDMANRAAEFVEEQLAGDGVAGPLGSGGGGVIEQIPLGHVEIAFGDLLAVAVAVGVVEADAGPAGLGRGANAAAILAGGGDELLGAGVGHQGQRIAIGAGVGGRVVGLQAAVDVAGRAV